MDASVINAVEAEDAINAVWADADFEPSDAELSSLASFVGEYRLDEIAPSAIVAECAWPSQCGCSECAYADWADSASESELYALDTLVAYSPNRWGY